MFAAAYAAANATMDAAVPNDPDTRLGIVDRRDPPAASLARRPPRARGHRRREQDRVVAVANTRAFQDLRREVDDGGGARRLVEEGEPRRHPKRSGFFAPRGKRATRASVCDSARTNEPERRGTIERGRA